MDEQEPNETTKAINALREEVEKLNNQHFFTAHKTWRSIAIYNLIRGLMFGLGSVVGATLLVYILIQILTQIDFIPIIGDWVHRIIEIIQTNKN